MLLNSYKAASTEISGKNGKEIRAVKRCLLQNSKDGSEFYLV